MCENLSGSVWGLINGELMHCLPLCTQGRKQIMRTTVKALRQLKNKCFKVFLSSYLFLLCHNINSCYCRRAKLWHFSPHLFHRDTRNCRVFTRCLSHSLSRLDLSRLCLIFSVERPVFASLWIRHTDLPTPALKKDCKHPVTQREVVRVVTKEVETISRCS